MWTAKWLHLILIDSDACILNLSIFLQFLFLVLKACDQIGGFVLMM